MKQKINTCAYMCVCVCVCVCYISRYTCLGTIGNSTTNDTKTSKKQQPAFSCHFLTYTHVSRFSVVRRRSSPPPSPSPRKLPPTHPHSFGNTTSVLRTITHSPMFPKYKKFVNILQYSFCLRINPVLNKFEMA